MKKVLVGITIQENSKRLIKAGSDLAASLATSFAILHIKQGDSIFEDPNSSALFEELFALGKTLGGEAHFVCSNDVPATLSEFIKTNEITDLVIGAAPIDGQHHPIVAPNYLGDVTVHIIDRLEA